MRAGGSKLKPSPRTISDPTYLEQTDTTTFIQPLSTTPKRKAIKTIDSRQRAKAIVKSSCLPADRQNCKYSNIVSFPCVIYSNVHNRQFFFFAGANALSRFTFYTLQCPKNSRLAGGRNECDSFLSPSAP